ncbi:hypothetical protein AgCh_031212 [Apium graveolens]
MATDELLRKLLGKLDEIDKRTQKLVNSTESRFDAWDKILIKVKDSDEVYDPGIDLGYFTGLGNIDDFVEWVTQVDKISAYTGWTEMRIFKIAALKLTKKADLWFDNLNIKRVRSGKEKIMTWTSLKKKLRAKYIPLHYKFECIMKMTSLSQGTMSVFEYTSEFYRLRLICDLEETETIKIGRFIRGLNLPIYRKVKSSPYISFNDVCNLALEFESFQHDEKLKSSLHEFTLSEETKEEDFVSVENVADLVADYHVLHVATTSSLEEKDEPVTKEAMVEKHEERQSLDDKFLVVEENQIDISLKLVCRDMVEEKKVLEDMFQTKEVVYKENNIIIVEHNDFLGVENLLNSPISSNYLILSSLLPKILLMELKFKAFKFYEKSPRYVLILKYFRTRGRVFFKGEENDEDQGMNIWKTESLRESIKRHEHFLALQLDLKPGQKVLDVGCRICGPLREVARFSSTSVTGLNNNEYQITRGKKLNRMAEVDQTCDFVKGDFMKMPFPNNNFDAVYAIVATCHAPDAAEIELGDGLPDIRLTTQCIEALKQADFEVAALEYVGLAPKEAKEFKLSWKKLQKGLLLVEIASQKLKEHTAHNSSKS